MESPDGPIYGRSWLNGRIYEWRSDLSPDGRHLIYFAMDGRWATKARGAWAAISRAPYPKALSLFAKGDCWHGGGVFLSGRDYWLNDGYGHTVEKRINNQWLLRKHAHAGLDHPVGRGVYFDTHALVNSRTGEEKPYADWEWADVDGSRSVWAAGGKLMAGRVTVSGVEKSTELQDFNDMEFERIRAPY